MRFLLCKLTEYTRDERWASADEPVVPNFPTGYANSFLGTVTFKPAIQAIVKDVSGLDIDVIADRLKVQFPGLPSELLATYVLETAKAAYALAIDTVCQIYIQPDTARILNIDTGETITLWTRQPVPEQYRR